MLKQFPNQIKAGLSLNAEISAPEFPAPDWTVTAILRGPSVLDLNAAGTGARHVFAESGSETAAYKPGKYSVSLRASCGGDVREIEAGTLDILPDLAGASEGHDPRKHAERVLEAIESVIESRASKDQMAYTINGRSLSRTPLADLLQLRDTYRKEVRALRGKRRPLFGRTVKVRM